MNASLSAWVSGIGLLAPGLADWPAARAVLRGEAAFTPAPTILPAPAILPPAERRRASRVVKLTLAIGMEAAAHAGADVATLATVFSASGADGHTCHALCEQLASDDRQISPTRFTNSVHNAAAGYWGIATHAMAPCQVICAYDATFGAGLIDALGQVVLDRQPTLLISYDSEYPEPLHATRPIPDVAGVALLLTPEPGEHALAHITLATTPAPAAKLGDPALEAQRQAIPALRALPLLELLAGGKAGAVVLDYLAPTQLQLTVTPC
ncbi:MAG: beta-ketoacyl synthase chain length factor [Dechloromonas sp.]|nr:MAG: beta-ketoacyl synthase chain length factor [Dechloromonas sp.]